MKKRAWIYPILCVLLGIGIFIGLQKPFPLPQAEKTELWISKRPLPKTIALDAYLKGNAARNNHDLEQALEAYLLVLKQDPQNKALLDDVYTLAMLQGTFGVMLPYLDQISNGKVLVDYAHLVRLLKEKKQTQALQVLRHKKDPILPPLISAWIYADQNEKESAIQQINTLKEFPFVAGYQKVLLGSYFEDKDLIQQGINQMGDHAIPAIGFFPLLKKIISQTGHWERAALNNTYQELAKTYPATAEVLVQIGETDITPQKGIAEAFYLVSALAGNGRYTRQESLAANSLALFLDPNKQISLVWGAELAEGLHLPKVALSYYQRLTFHSATLGFKEAATLMSLQRTKEALPRLEKLERTNRTSIPLLSLLGQAYQETNQPQKAMAIYNRLIPLLEANPKNEPLMQAYLLRSLLYAPQDRDKMLDDLKRAHALAPDNAMLLNDLGYHQLETGLINEGFELVQNAYQKRPNDPYILDSLAFGYWKKGQANVALPLAERALDLMPQSALINAHLGDIYEALGRHREAGFQYKKALDLKTDLSDALTQELTQKLKEKQS